MTYTYEVTADKTAEAMGSGDMPVLATPALVAMMENAAMRVAAEGLSEGDTTVGALINTSHLKPSAVGAVIAVEATLGERDGRKLSFSIVARDGDTIVGEAQHVRYVVTRDKFLSKVYPPK